MHIAAEKGNLAAIEFLAALQKTGTPVPGDIRSLMRNALHTAVDTEGLRRPGMTGFQSLYVVTMEDALLGLWGPKDIPEYVRMAVAAGPLYVQFMEQLHSPRPGFVLACMLTGGATLDGVPIQGIPKDATIAMRFFRMAADGGDSDARRVLEALRAGNTATCQANLHG